ncbi:hypothetical protein D1871_11575 [Nakamurella silvestris]|nr:hypothetical protein D1871_11575 [Nakamurella silvestris]
MMRSLQRPLRRVLVGGLVAALITTFTPGIASATPLPAPAAATVAAAPGKAPTSLTVQSLPAPVDVEELTALLLGWQLGAGKQSAYEVQVATSETSLAAPDIWDSGKITGSANANISYAGPALSPSSGYYWRVRTWDGGDTASAWSEISHFGTGPGSTWDGASPIWTPGVASGWTDYTFEGTFNITTVAASVNFRAKDTNNFYMWQFRAGTASTDPNTLKIHANAAGSYAVLSVVALPFPLDVATNYDFKIVVAGTSISSYLKLSTDSTWVFVNTTDDSSFTSGGIGFRTGSTEAAYYDNLKVTDPTGTVLYSNDFSDSTTTDFTCGTVTGGRLSIGASKNCAYGIDWQNYTTQVTLNITSNTAAVTLKGTSTTSFYLWQLKVGATAGTIVINKNVAGTYTALKTVTLGKPVVAGTNYVLKVVALGTTYKTYLDGVLVDTTTDATYTTGRVGFRSGGTESFVASNLSITQPDGSPFYANNFPAGNTDFPCGTITGGTLVVPLNANCLLAAPSTNWAFLRGDVSLPAGKTVAWAHLFATGASTNPGRQYVYKMWVNDTYVGVGPTRPIGNETRYDGYDVTSLLTNGGANTIGALAYSTSDQRFLAKLVVTYTDGSTQTFGTGAGWKALNGSAILPDAGSIGTSYYAAPKENFSGSNYPFGFAASGFNDSTWKPAVVKTAFTGLAATPTAKVERQLRAPSSVVEYSPGNYFIDYGRTWVGGLSLDLTGTAGQVLDIRYGEVTSAANTVKYATSGGNNYQDLWTLKAGKQHLETWGMRVFRYVQVLGAPTGLTTADFPAEAYVYPYDPTAGVFDSSDSTLNQVYALNKNSIESLNGNLYVDSWERERGAYEADSYLQMMSNFYTSADPTLGNYSIAYLFKQRTWPTEWPMYIILAMHDSYAQTGDIAALNTQYTALQAKLPDAWYESSTGLIRKTSGSSGAGSCTDCDIVDWPTTERDGFVFTQYNTVINAIGYRSYVDMAEIATALGKTADAATYTAKAAAIKAAVNSLMWDPAKGAYRDGLATDRTPTAHWAVQSSVFATAFGLASDEQAASVASYIGSRGMVCSVYCAAFLFQALYNGGRADLAYDLLTSTGTRSYMNMINAGAGATMEAWSLSLKSNTTYSHPWAASVAFNLPQGMFGIRPTTAGYDTFDIKPQPAKVNWAHVTVPTLKGRIGVAYDTVGDRVDVGVTVPANSVARVYVPGATAGMTSIYQDGISVPATYDGGYLRVETVTPGCHVFSTVAGPAAGANSRLTGICLDGYQAPDTTGPVVTAVTSPAEPSGANGWFTGATTVTLSATDDSGVAGIEYRTDGSTWTTYSTPVSAPEGVTTVNYRATDTAGNVSTGTLTVSKDSVAPVSTIAFDDVNGTTFGPVPVGLTATDATSGVGSISYRIDGGPWTGYQGTFSVSGGGTHQVSYRATDLAGNVEAARTAEVRIKPADTTAPVVSATVDPAEPNGTNGFYRGTAPKVTLAVTDEGDSGINVVQYRIDAGTWVDYTAPVTVTEGAHTLAWRATDNAGNTSTAGSILIRYDNTAPVSAVAFQTGDGHNPVLSTVTATDAVSGVAQIEYSLDGGPWRTYRSAFVISGNSTHTVQSRAKDLAGNTGSAHSATVTITAPPAGSMTFEDVTPANRFAADIQWMYDNGISTGTAQNGNLLYQPGLGVSRQAVAAFLYRYAHSTWVPAAGTQTFADVTASNPFYKEIEWMAHQQYALGTVVPGSAKPYFRPNDSIQRQAVAVFLWRFAGSPTTGTVQFPDVGASTSFAAAVSWVGTTGVANGYDDGTFRPGTPISREAFAAVLHRYDLLCTTWT